jgi:hypothetical protein
MLGELASQRLAKFLQSQPRLTKLDQNTMLDTTDPRQPHIPENVYEIEDLAAILVASKRNNARAGVTGAPA